MADESHLKIFITGATGYIGGSILSALLAHRESASFSISTIVRNAEKAAKLRDEFGISVTVGSHTDKAIVEPLTEAAHVIFTAANADDLDGVYAVIAGMRRRKERTGIAPVLIHTSGTAVLGDDAHGMHGSSTVYSDLDVEALAALPATRPHRLIELAVLAADAEGVCRAYTVVPAAIYARASNVLVERGIANARSVLPRWIAGSLMAGRVSILGKGENMWGNVHIDDVIALYLLIFDAVQSDSPPPSGQEGIFFGANDEHRFYDLAKQIGLAMAEIGKCADPEPKTWTLEEVARAFGQLPEGLNKTFGSNARCRADRGYALGWKPTHTVQDMYDSIRAEMATMMEEGRKRP